MGKSLFEHRCTGHKHKQACSSKHDSTIMLQQLTRRACQQRAKKTQKQTHNGKVTVFSDVYGSLLRQQPGTPANGIYTACVLAGDAVSHNARCSCTAEVP